MAEADEATAASSRSLRGVYERGTGVDFDRMIFFTDAVYAIAMTLLIVTVELPKLSGDVTDPAVLWDAITDSGPKILGFFIGFVLLGRYWLAHHEFTTWLQAIDRTLMSTNLIYLAFVAFLPFPTALIGGYEDNPLSVTLFGITLALVSGMETVLFIVAYRHELLRTRISREAYRYGVAASTAPVVVFLASIPLAFLVSPTVALLSWLVAIPIQIVMARIAPATAHSPMGPGASHRNPPT
ncbi:MAG: TMEM175 family protein [Actinomycetota bacterium]